MACGGDSGTDPAVANTSTQLPEVSPNPQTWTLLAGDIPIANGGGFRPTKTLRVGNLLRTYFVRTDNIVVFATSADGKDLATNITATNLQRSTTVGDNRYGLDHPSVIQRADGKFLMVYDYLVDPANQFSKRLVARVSDDGITWGNGVLMPATDIDKSPGAGTPFQGVTGLVKLANGSIRAYYTAAGRGVGSAVTTDGGVTWTEDAKYRLVGGEADGYGDVGAMVDTDGAVLLYVHYTTNFNSNVFSIRMARSTDGIAFAPYAGSILTPPGSTRYDDPDVFIAADGKWRMLLGWSDGTVNHVRMAERQ